MKHINRFRILAAAAIIFGGMLIAFWVLRYAQTLAKLEATIDGKHYVFVIEDRGRFNVGGPDLRAVVRSHSGGESIVDILDGPRPSDIAQVIIDETARTISFITGSDTLVYSFDNLP